MGSLPTSLKPFAWIHSTHLARFFLMKSKTAATLGLLLAAADEEEEAECESESESELESALEVAAVTCTTSVSLASPSSSEDEPEESDEDEPEESDEVLSLDEDSSSVGAAGAAHCGGFTAAGFSAGCIVATGVGATATDPVASAWKRACTSPPCRLGSFPASLRPFFLSHSTHFGRFSLINASALCSVLGLLAGSDDEDDEDEEEDPSSSLSESLESLLEESLPEESEELPESAAGVAAGWLEPPLCVDQNFCRVLVVCRFGSLPTSVRSCSLRKATHSGRFSLANVSSCASSITAAARQARSLGLAVAEQKDERRAGAF